MSTVNGVGTMYYDWKHYKKNISEATEWFVIGFFPIFPLKRVRLRVIVNGKKPSFFSTTPTEESLQIQHIFLKQVPATEWSIIRTYLKGWLLVPLTMFGPMTLVLLLGSLVQSDSPGTSESVDLSESPLLMAFVIASVMCFFVMVAVILDRSKGLRPKHRRRN